ncbi:MAG TPA: DUF6036 family nucleotidyltransferase [Kofleriaceae bacterium]|nr:DUF6036 family nucleotidyltransferase [Kofleriaceae bacterium]
MQLVRDFFADVDRGWPAQLPRAQLSLIGCAALIVQASYERGTKDSDVFETTDLSAPVKAFLLQHAGPGSELHKRRHLYVDIVANGVPFLPHAPRWLKPVGLNDGYTNIELLALDIVDVVVSKLKRFNANDQSDIDAMVTAGHVRHADLVRRFRAAVDEFSADARAEDLPKYVTHLHRVERDMLGVPESDIELPPWI